MKEYGREHLENSKKKKNTKAERSRPMAKFDEWLTKDGLLRLEAWARDGLTDEQIAKNCGITSKTLRVWKKQFGSISAALKRGKEAVDIEVENALLKRALGYSYKESTFEMRKGTMTLTKVVTKEVQPDVTAQIFWLKNRKPAEWRDKRQIDTNISTGGDFVLKIKPSDETDRV
jgi:transposase-like protein